jgi:hypothetical protein
MLDKNVKTKTYAIYNKSNFMFKVKNEKDRERSATQKKLI